MTDVLPPSVMHERMLTRLRLRHLRLLVALGAEGTLHRAAKAIGISQPAATQLLHELEELLQLRLFERHARGMRATPAASVLMEHGRSIIDSLRTACDALSAQASGQDLLRIGGTPAGIRGLLEPVLEDFHQRHPALQLEVVEDGSERLLAALAAGALNLVLLRAQGSLPDGMRFESLRGDRAVVLASCRHPAATSARVRLRDLGGQRWILPPASFAIRRLFDDLFDKAGLTPCINEVRTTSATLLPLLLRSDDVVAPVPEVTVDAAVLAQRGLVQLALDERLLGLGALGVVWREDATGNATLALLAELRVHAAAVREAGCSP